VPSISHLPQRQGRLAHVVKVSLLKAAATKTRIIRRRLEAITTSHWLGHPLPLQLQRWLVGVMARETTSAPIKRPAAMTAMQCPVHNSMCHNARECREIKKLTEQFREKQQQSHQDGTHSHQNEGKQKVDPEEGKDEKMEFQNAKRALKAVYDHSDSNSSIDEPRKMLHIMYGGSWDITSWRVVKTLRQAMAMAAPAPSVVPHHKWMETLIGFDASDCPKNMAGAGQLPLLVSPTIANIKLYHVLVDGGAALNLISLVAFKMLQILMSKLAPSRPFSRVGSGSIMP
jgi:hypothetical protein